MDAYSENLSKKEQKFGNSGTLAQEVQTGFIYQRGMLPTPRANQVNGCDLNSENLANRNKGNLEETVAKWVTGLLPTPTTQETPYPNAEITETGRRKAMNGNSHSMNLADAFQTDGKTSQLNPRFVLEMMGFPPDWTELPFLNGETNQSKQQETP